MVDIIERKRDGHALTREEIDFFVQGYTKGDIPDYQASAFCMAVYFRGMNELETSWLTDSMVHSGGTVDLSAIPGKKVDKHSTGGVGDKTSLVLGPLVASCGAKLAKMSGRGLGHTGGTLDKMESVPGTRIALARHEFEAQVRDIGMAIVGQTGTLVPADKKLYALRDVTGSVGSIPLIASSIMSKKLAAGSDGILLDVKFGSGAFMKTMKDAKELAETMVKIGDSLGRDTRAIITDMDEPLGCAVGNALEVQEAALTLQNKGPKDLTELVIKAGGIMLEQAGVVSSVEEGEAAIQESLQTGAGFRKMKQFFAAQGGDASYLDDFSKFPKAKYALPIFAEKDGYVHHIDSMKIGVGAMKLGAGRAEMDDEIDMAAGIVLAKKVGDAVKKGEILATCYTNKSDYAPILQEISSAFRLKKEPCALAPIVHAYIH